MTTSKANRLTKAQNFKLYEWAKEKCSEGALHGMTDKAVAEMAGFDLDFVISESSVSDLRNDQDIPITWRTSKDKAPELPLVDESDMRVLASAVLKIVRVLDAMTSATERTPLDSLKIHISPELSNLFDKMGIGEKPWL